MTAKEKLRERVEALSEQEASQALRLLEDADPVIAAFRDAPLDDEPLTTEEQAAIDQGRAEYHRGEGISLDEIRHEFS